jgi:hypothetical protein
LPCLALPCPALPCLALPCPALPCLALPCPANLLACLNSPLPVCLSACLSVCLSACLPVCLSACLPVCLSACLPVCLSACHPHNFHSMEDHIVHCPWLSRRPLTKFFNFGQFAPKTFVLMNKNVFFNTEERSKQQTFLFKKVFLLSFQSCPLQTYFVLDKHVLSHSYQPFITKRAPARPGKWLFYNSRQLYFPEYFRFEENCLMVRNTPLGQYHKYFFCSYKFLSRAS